MGIEVPGGMKVDPRERLKIEGQIGVSQQRSDVGDAHDKMGRGGE